jgi:hypothetical protein
MTSNAPEPLTSPPPLPGERGKPAPVFVTVAVRTSAGPGPGVKQLPPAEAGRLVAQKLAVHGDKPPWGWTLPVPEP